jgi:hypothetical protein
LSQSEKLHDLLDLGVDLVDTLSSDNKGNLGFRGNVEISRVSGLSLLGNEVSLGLLIGLEVFLSLVSPFLSSGFDEGFFFLSLLGKSVGLFLVSFLLSGEGLGNETKTFKIRITF